ncbi:MAG: VCBS repeat-containing protein [Spirochaetales bacterium]|nr:VCBS repeat-containing protein [Spirochaetales bacterium]
MNKKIKALGISLLVIFLLMLMTIGVFIGLAALNREKAEDFFPNNHILRIEVDSVSSLIENLTDWSAAEILLSEPEMADFYQSFLEWKNNPLRDNRLVKRALSMEADILLNDQFQSMIIVNMGWRSSLYKLFLHIESVLNLSDAEIQSFSYERKLYSAVTLPPKAGEEAKGDQIIYLYSRGNILLICTDETFLKETLSGAPFPSRDRLKYDFGNRADLKIHLNSEELLTLFTEDFPQLAQIEKDFIFHKEILLAINVEEDHLNMEGYIPFQTESTEVIDYLNRDPGLLRVPESLPPSVNILSGFRYTDPDSLLTMINSFLTEEGQISLESYDGLSKSLLGLSTAELLTDWLGNEAGAFTLEGFSSNPVLFAEIGNKANLAIVLEALKSNLFIKVKDNLLLDDTRVTLLTLPAPLKALLQLFTGPIEEPFIITEGNYLYISDNPETLAHLSRELKGRNRLSSTSSFKSVTGKLPERSPLLFYYDLNTAMPRFLLNNQVHSQLLRYYEKGHFYLSYHRDEIRFQFHGERAPIEETSPFPGFPVDTKEKIFSPVLIGDLGESRLPEFAFINKNEELIITNILGTPLSRTVLPQKSSLLEIVPGEGVKTFGEKGFLTVPPGGVGLGEEGESFPFDWTFAPIPFDGDYLIFNRDGRQLVRLNENTRTPLSLPYSKVIINPPSLWKNQYIGVYPKDLFGTYYLLDNRGEPLENWPQKAGSIALQGPQFFEYEGRAHLMFLTQKGILEIRDRRGKILQTPLSLEGNFLAPPVSLKGEEGTLLALINSKGEISVLTPTGEYVAQWDVRIPESEDTRLLPYDIDGDGRDELFLYGAGSRLYGWQSDFSPLPGFPVTGHYKPEFQDLDNNGKMEIISGGMDGKIHAYTIRTGEKETL